MNLNQVTVPTTDLARSIEFYRRLGLLLIVSDPPDYARLERSDGAATFSVHRTETQPAVNGPVICFEAANLDTLYAKLCSRGIRFDSPPTDQPWLWREASLRDPDGNTLCLLSADRNRRHPPW